MTTVDKAVPLVARRQKGLHRRVHCASVRLSAVEHQKLKTWAIDAQKKMGELLREVALGRTPPVVPSLNQERWEAHARTLANLNQIAYALNQGKLIPDVRPLLSQLVGEVQALRAELRGEEPLT